MLPDRRKDAHPANPLHTKSSLYQALFTQIRPRSAPRRWVMWCVLCGKSYPVRCLDFNLSVDQLYSQQCRHGHCPLAISPTSFHRSSDVHSSGSTASASCPAPEGVIVGDWPEDASGYIDLQWAAIGSDVCSRGSISLHQRRYVQPPAWSTAPGFPPTLPCSLRRRPTGKGAPP